MEINGGGTVGGDRRHRVEVGEDWAAGLLQGRTGEVGAEHGGLVTSVQEELLAADVRWYLG